MVSVRKQLLFKWNPLGFEANEHLVSRVALDSKYHQLELVWEREEPFR